MTSVLPKTFTVIITENTSLKVISAVDDILKLKRLKMETNEKTNFQIFTDLMRLMVFLEQ